MTSLERVRIVLRGEIPDRVPICLLSFQNAARFAGLSVREYCRSGERMAEAQLAYWEEFRHDIIDIENGVAAMAEAVGCKVEYPENEPPWVIKPAIESLDDIDKLPDVDPLRSPSLAELIKATEIISKKLGKSVCIRGESDQGPFSLASEILGSEKFLTALLDPDQTDKIHTLLTYAEEQIIKLARAQIRAGSHYSMIGDSIAGPDVCSPKMYRQYAFPYEKSLLERLEKEGIGMGIHICGNATAIIEDMVKTGSLYFELDYKIGRERVRRMTDDKVTIFGTLDPSNLLCRGTLEEIADKVKEDILLLGQKGRYVLSPGCTLPYSTPFENVRALVEVGRQFGRYGKDGKI
jgi:uroporphyrinogen decarboxylase